MVSIINPWTGAVDYQYDYQSPAEVERRLQQAALAAPAWAARPLAERAELLRRVAKLLRQECDDIATIVSAEMGKLIREARAEVEKSASACDYYAEHAADYLADQPIATEALSSYVRYEPLGCVLAVMPWNFPIWQVFRFLAPALMAGNVALLKHATTVPRSADRIGALLASAGAPAGVLGVLHIDNAGAAAVIADPRVHAVSLTGSERAGRSVAASAGAALKKCVLELGGSDPFVLLDDADLNAAIPVAIASRFGNAGQTCIAAKRFIVTPGIADAFVRRLVAAAEELKVGDPSDPATGLAPMARADLRDSLHEQVQASIAAGAKLCVGGVPGAGRTAYPATVLDQVGPGMPAYTEELFGPVAAVIRVADAEAALAVANASRFGLGASVWTEDRERGDRFARGLEAGACFVNSLVRSDPRLPFGGSKASGYGRELAEHGIREFTNIKTVYVA